jgi:hypothetical protein
MDGVDAVFRALVHSRRRISLAHLQEHRTILLPDLAELVTERECDNDLDELPAEQVTDTYFSLYHRHIPILDDAGLAQYDQETDCVRRSDECCSLLAAARDEIQAVEDI